MLLKDKVDEHVGHRRMGYCKPCALQQSAAHVLSGTAVQRTTTVAVVANNENSGVKFNRTQLLQ